MAAALHQVKQETVNASDQLKAATGELAAIPAQMTLAVENSDEAALGRLMVRRMMLESKLPELRAAVDAASDVEYEQRLGELSSAHAAAMRHAAEVVGQAQAMIVEARRAEGEALMAMQACRYEHEKARWVPPTFERPPVDLSNYEESATVLGEYQVRKPQWA